MAIISEIQLSVISNNKHYSSKIIWYLKQLFPLLYFSEYKIYINREMHMVTSWNMWLGKCYNIRSFEIIREVEHMTDKEIA